MSAGQRISDGQMRRGATVHTTRACASTRHTWSPSWEARAPTHASTQVGHRRPRCFACLQESDLLQAGVGRRQATDVSGWGQVPHGPAWAHIGGDEPQCRHGKKNRRRLAWRLRKVAGAEVGEACAASVASRVWNLQASEAMGGRGARAPQPVCGSAVKTNCTAKQGEMLLRVGAAEAAHARPEAKPVPQPKAQRSVAAAARAMGSRRACRHWA